MLSKLPVWVGTGSFLLAFAAGSINVFVLESAIQQAVTHHSGSSSAMMLAVSRGDLDLAAHYLALISAFVAGSILSGFIVRDLHLKLGRRYGVSLILESATIVGAMALFDADPFVSQVMLSAASGLQNAMATSYSGAVVRTTHLTGLLTDIGVLLGNRLAGIPMPPRKLRLLTDILFGFLSGGLAGGLLYGALGNAVLAIPAIISGGLGLAYFAYRRFALRSAA